MIKLFLIATILGDLGVHGQEIEPVELCNPFAGVEYGRESWWSRAEMCREPVPTAFLDKSTTGNDTNPSIQENFYRHQSDRFSTNFSASHRYGSPGEDSSNSDEDGELGWDECCFPLAPIISTATITSTLPITRTTTVTLQTGEGRGSAFSTTIFDASTQTAFFIAGSTTTCAFDGCQAYVVEDPSVIIIPLNYGSPITVTTFVTVQPTIECFTMQICGPQQTSQKSAPKDLTSSDQNGTKRVAQEKAAFPVEDKADSMQDLLQSILSVYGTTLQGLRWQDPETREIYVQSVISHDGKVVYQNEAPRQCHGRSNNASEAVEVCRQTENLPRKQSPAAATATANACIGGPGSWCKDESRQAASIQAHTNEFTAVSTDRIQQSGANTHNGAQNQQHSQHANSSSSSKENRKTATTVHLRLVSHEMPTVTGV